MDMKERLQELAENARKRIEESEGLDKLNDVRVAYLGKKGELTAILKGMKDVAPEERPKVGQLVNETRAKIEELLEASKKDFEEKVREEKMKAEVIDVTLPAKKAKIGHRHPNTIALEEVERIFIGMGYEVVEGPESEKLSENSGEISSAGYSVSASGMSVFARSGSASDTEESCSSSELIKSEISSVFSSVRRWDSSVIPVESSPKSRSSARTADAGCRHISAASVQARNFFFIVLVLLMIIFCDQGISAIYCFSRFRVSSFV